jgi:hypothetical protein
VQGIATGIDVCIALELGAMKRAQEVAASEKKKTPQKTVGVDQVTKLLFLTRDPL